MFRWFDLVNIVNECRWTTKEIINKAVDIIQATDLLLTITNSRLASLLHFKIISQLPFLSDFSNTKCHLSNLISIFLFKYIWYKLSMLINMLIIFTSSTGSLSRPIIPGSTFTRSTINTRCNESTDATSLSTSLSTRVIAGMLIATIFSWLKDKNPRTFDHYQIKNFTIIVDLSLLVSNWKFFCS